MMNSYHNMVGTSHPVDNNAATIEFNLPEWKLFSLKYEILHTIENVLKEASSKEKDIRCMTSKIKQVNHDCSSMSVFCQLSDGRYVPRLRLQSVIKSEKLEQLRGNYREIYKVQLFAFLF
jgi:hypothetical protein